MNFLSSPTIVTAMAFSGKLSFNPTKDELITPDGSVFRFSPPKGETLPAEGFTPGISLFRFLYRTLTNEYSAGRLDLYPQANPKPMHEMPVVIDPNSSRLELLEPFESLFEGKNAVSIGELPALTCLMRVRGKCTTDHISAAVSVSRLLVN
jgi:homoaconitase